MLEIWDWRVLTSVVSAREDLDPDDDHDPFADEDIDGNPVPVQAAPPTPLKLTHVAARTRTFGYVWNWPVGIPGIAVAPRPLGPQLVPGDPRRRRLGVTLRANVDLTILPCFLEYLGRLRWAVSNDGAPCAVTFVELALDFESCSGRRLLSRKILAEELTLAHTFPNLPTFLSTLPSCILNMMHRSDSRRSTVLQHLM